MSQIFSEHKGRARLGGDRDDIKADEGRNAIGLQWGRDFFFHIRAENCSEGPGELEEYWKCRLSMGHRRIHSFYLK